MKAKLLVAALALFAFSSAAYADEDVAKKTCKDCKPAKVTNEKLNIPAPAPQRVKVKQQIIVETEPEIIYAPMEVRVQQPRPVVHHVHKWHADAPPPPRVVLGAPCPPPRQVTICRTPRCPPRQVSMCGPRPCPAPGYGYGPVYPGRNQQVAQLPTKTDDGLAYNPANTAPGGAKPCTRMVNGVPVTGKCW